MSQERFTCYNLILINYPKTPTEYISILKMSKKNLGWNHAIKTIPTPFGDDNKKTPQDVLPGRQQTL